MYNDKGNTFGRCLCLFYERQVQFVSERSAGGSIREKLLWEMRSGVFAGAQRLPRENTLAQMLGISRTQLRDSLSSLEREGFISRRHGVGTVINHHVLNVNSRMDMETEFMDMVRNAGFEPGVIGVEHSIIPCDKEIAARLKAEIGSDILLVSRVVTADGRPAIYCEDYIASGKIKDNSFDDASLVKPIFHFLERYCDAYPVMDLTQLHPLSADKRLADILQIPEGTAILYMDEVDYDIEGEPVFCSRDYYVDGIVSHTVLRKKF